MSDGDEESRADRRDRYESVLACVQANTYTDPDRDGLPGAPRTQVVLSLAAHGQYQAAAVKRSLRAAVEQDDLYHWVDRQGRDRFTPVDEDALLALTNWVVAQGHPAKQRIVAASNRLRQDQS
jgi:hypothetical protein